MPSYGDTRLLLMKNGAKISEIRRSEGELEQRRGGDGRSGRQLVRKWLGQSSIIDRETPKCENVCQDHVRVASPTMGANRNSVKLFLVLFPHTCHGEAEKREQELSWRNR